MAEDVQGLHTVSLGVSHLLVECFPGDLPALFFLAAPGGAGIPQPHPLGADRRLLAELTGWL